MEERIMTLHPQGKAGANISREKYNIVKQVIVEIVTANEGITFKALNEAAQERLDGRFEGSISWYVTTVKLDLEARHVIERLPGRSPQQLRMVGA